MSMKILRLVSFMGQESSGVQSYFAILCNTLRTSCSGGENMAYDLVPEISRLYPNGS